jgi:hypothetical protein
MQCAKYGRPILFHGHCYPMLLLIIFVLFLPITTAGYERPVLITDALSSNKVIHYFAVGSNLLKAKLTNRGLNGTKINIQKFEPGYVNNYRVAFNVPGFAPIEPAMAGIEPCEHSECHGALVTISANEYQKLWLSEGGGRKLPGYQEIIVHVHPYPHRNHSNGSNIRTIPAISLRAADHIRLKRDRDPSSRYMSIIKKGAEELGLISSYQDMLGNTPVAKPSKILQWMSRQHLYTTSYLFKFTWCGLGVGMSIQRCISRLCLLLYASSSRAWYIRFLSELAMAVVLVPGCLFGYISNTLLTAIGKPYTPIFSGIIDKPKRK